MILSNQMQLLIKEQLRTRPLSADEVRRVERMGELYVSRLSKERLDSSVYTYKYTLEIEGVSYHFYGRKQ